MKAPSVSVVIPCYNDSRHVTAAVESVLVQTYKNIEIIVIDDGSIDDSLNIIKSFEQRDNVIWDYQENQGAPAARNRGISLAAGHYVKFLDADDCLFDENVIERQVRQSEALPKEKKAIVYGNTVILDGQGNKVVIHSKKQRPAKKDPILHILSHSPLTASPLHRKDYLEEVDGFDERIKKGQEYDLHLRLVLEGVEFVHHDLKVYFWQQHDEASRIANQLLSSLGSEGMLADIRRKENLIVNKRGQLTDDLSARLARLYWSSGRSLLRESKMQEAKPFFAEARRLHSERCIAGNEPYSTLARFLGPYRAERISEKLKLWFR